MIKIEFSAITFKLVGIDFDIFDILNQNQSYIILTFIDNKDSNDDKTFNFTNSINFRKIKNGNIGAFTDFDIMRSYTGNYISTEIIHTGDFIKLCGEYDITSISLEDLYFLLPMKKILLILYLLPLSISKIKFIELFFSCEIFGKIFTSKKPD